MSGRGLVTFKDNQVIMFNGDRSGGEFNKTPGIAKLADGEKRMRREVRYYIMYSAGFLLRALSST